MSAELSDQQLVHKMLQVERDLVDARFKHSMNQLENTAHLGGLRKEIAKLKTEARKREQAAGLEKNALFAKHVGSFGASSADDAAAPAEKGGFLSGIVDKLTNKD